MAHGTGGQGWGVPLAHLGSSVEGLDSSSRGELRR